ncbi:carbohydrate ABC transporter substrate-binding protein [Anaerolineae bacterium CFX9]|nr:carbohydrate ABC transporter substrate-binding protein [Anaerolineae bacterium CFX9]
MSLLVLLALVIFGVFGAAVAQESASGELEIFSWWTGGGEEAGLNALIARFSELYPDVQVVNAAVAGGSGVNARAVLTTRMLGGDPPDTFQVHAGEELNALWVAAGLMEPLNDIYEANGWMDQFPQGLLDLITDEAGNIYVVPVNIHRSNVLWYVPGNLEQWGVSIPASWDEFVNSTCPALQAQGVTPISIGENWTQVHLWESVALGVLGVEGYNGLWNGSTNWASDEVINTFTTLGQVMDCANDDMNALTWQDASQRVANGEAAFNIMGDWAAGYYLVDLGLEPEVGFGWAASPGTDGVFMMLSDSFGLPVGAPNPGAVRAWLSFLGTAEAQDLFNPVKGSLPANTTADIGNSELYNAYFQSAYNDWTTNEIVGSLAHGLVAAPAFLNGFSNVIATFQADRDATNASVTAAALALQTLR